MTDDKADRRAFLLELAKSVMVFIGVCGLAAMVLGYDFSTCVYAATGMKMCWMATQKALGKV